MDRNTNNIVLRIQNIIKCRNHRVQTNHKNFIKTNRTTTNSKEKAHLIAILPIA